MRKRVWALAAALLMLLLTGCGSLLNRDYSVTEPHSSSYYESEDRSVLRAESYQDLVNALLVLISGGAKEGTIWLYPDDSGLPAPQAAERACLEVQKETPLGAYAVEYLTYTVDETPRNYDAIQLTVGLSPHGGSGGGHCAYHQHLRSGGSAAGGRTEPRCGAGGARWATSTIRRRRSAHR